MNEETIKLLYEWKAGAIIQEKRSNGDWWKTHMPPVDTSKEYRVKPKDNIVEYVALTSDDYGNRSWFDVSQESNGGLILKFTKDCDTGTIISVGIHKQ